MIATELVWRLKNVKKPVSCDWRSFGSREQNFAVESGCLRGYSALSDELVLREDSLDANKKPSQTRCVFLLRLTVRVIATKKFYWPKSCKYTYCSGGKFTM